MHWRHGQHGKGPFHGNIQRIALKGTDTNRCSHHTGVPQLHVICTRRGASIARTYPERAVLGVGEVAVGHAEA
eukprot:scaffold9597_cov20-Tisochrysis_lutea.AAC.4